MVEGPRRPVVPPASWAEPLFTFGVTGTNGKTSTVHMLAAIVRAAYDPVLPDVAEDASHALRLAARMGRAGPD